MRRRPVTYLFGFADLVCTSVRCSDWKKIRRHGLVLSSLPLLVLILAFAPAAHASTNLYVNGATGKDSNNCQSAQHACKTIGHAISLASSGYTVKVAPSTYTENLTIGISLNILGADARTTIVDGNQAGTVFTISSPSAVVLLSGLTIQNGSAAGGYSGGITSEGTLTVSNCTITGNDGAGGYGGGIVNIESTLTVLSSTITGNSATSAYGGGIVNIEGTATVTNSTITGNSATDGYVGGIANIEGTTTFSSSTITANSAGEYGAGVFSDQATTTFQNTILANSGANCYGTVSSSGYNLSSDDSCSFNGKGDRNDKAPKLEKLGYYGGDTQTLSELLKSATVDKGNPKGCTDGEGHKLTTDQRGDPRPGKDKKDKRCDIGAYERQTD
jgi:hypothetical protein